jgi:hypothetical protein
MFTQGLSPEWQVLLACVQLEREPTAKQRLRQLLRTNLVNWERLTTIAQVQGIAPLVHHHMRRIPDVETLIPSTALTQVRESYYRAALHNSLLFTALRMVLRTAADRGCPLVVLKGAALAEPVYGNRALRPMGDIDLLVHAEDFSALEEQLSALGYQRYESQRERTSFGAHDYHIGFLSEVGTPREVHVEVHWQLERDSRPFAIDTAGLWNRARTATIAEVETLVLSPEDALLYLCLHTCKHRFAYYGVRALCDIAVLVHHDGARLNWQEVQARAELWRIRPYVYVVFSLAAELVGAPIPTWIVEVLRPPSFDDRLLGWVRDEMVTTLDEANMQAQLLRLWNGRGMAAKVAVVRELLTSEERARGDDELPAARTQYGSVVRRGVELLRHYGPQVVHLLREDVALRPLAARKERLAEWLAPFAHLPSVSETRH